MIRRTHLARCNGTSARFGRSFTPGDEVTILRTDVRALRRWKDYASLAQTIADLFATPGWQAAEFRYAMPDRFIRERDWEQI